MSSPFTSGCRSRLCANVAIACLVYFIAALITLHILRPDYAPRSHFISDYAVGEFGWIMTTAFLALSGACCALAAGMALDGPKSISARTGVVLFFVATLGLILTAIYKTDLPGGPYTRSGDIHEITFRVNTLSLILGSFLLSLSFAVSERWRSFRWPALSIFALIVIAVVIQVKTLHKNAPYGWANRFFVAVMISWLLATALRLRKVASLGLGNRKT